MKKSMISAGFFKIQLTADLKDVEANNLDFHNQLQQPH